MIASIVFLLLVPAARGAAADIAALADLARASPPEFAADALLRLAADGRVDPPRRREWIEEAFNRAAAAQQKLKKRAIPAVRGGSAGYLDRAFAQNLDGMSLQCRAVRAMLPLDRRQAREMFRRIPVPTPGRMSCDDALVYDVSAYYDTLREILATGFTAAEIAEDEPFKLASDYLRGLESPVQAGPAARVLASAPLPRAQLEPLVMSYSASLKEIAGDDRSFSFSVSKAGRAAQEVAALAAACRKLEIPTAPLIEAFRAYLVRHLRGERCADSGERQSVAFGMQVPAEEELGEDPVRFFNETLRADPVKPIAPEETQPSKVEGAAGGLRGCDTEECRRMATLYRGLIFSPGGMPFGEAAKATGEWQGKLREYIAALADWREDSSGSAEHFRQKCALYSDLANIVPHGPDRVAVLRAFLDFLKQNSFQRESRMEWFLPVNSLIARVSLDPLGLGDLMRDLRGSPDVVIALYAALEEAAPRPPGDRLSIF